MNEPIYRIPPYEFHDDIMTKSELSDVIDWGLKSNKIPEQWAVTQGKGILVGVIDTGASSHVDLPKPVFAINMSSSQGVNDKQGHSTHVTGTIAARANDRGVVGVAPLCEVGIVKGLGDDGSGNQRNLAAAIRRCVTEGCNIINMSWGGGYSQVIEDALKFAEENGVLCVCAAGNEGYSGKDTVNHPGSSERVVTIASYNSSGKISNFSSGGKAVDLAFPGERILSTWLNNKYNTISGTSMATPFACGVAALAMASYRARFPEWVPKLRVQRVLEIIESTSQDTGPTGKDPQWGWGRVDMDKVVGWGGTKPPVPPVPPTPVDSAVVGPYTIKFDGKLLTISQ